MDDARSPIPEDFLSRVDAALASGRRGDAVKLFLKLLGVPGIFITFMPFFPM